MTAAVVVVVACLPYPHPSSADPSLVVAAVAIRSLLSKSRRIVGAVVVAVVVVVVVVS